MNPEYDHIKDLNAFQWLHQDQEKDRAFSYPPLGEALVQVMSK